MRCLAVSRNSLVRAVFVGLFVCSRLVDAQNLEIQPGGRLYREALGNFASLEVSYTCPPAAKMPFRGSGFAAGVVGDRIILSTAAHVVFPPASRLGGLPATPSCKYELKIEVGASTAVLSQDEVLTYLVTPTNVFEPFRSRFRATVEGAGASDIALLVLPRDQLQPSPIFHSFPVLCPYEDKGDFELLAFTTGSGAALAFSRVTGPYEPPPGVPAPVARWKLDDLVREGVSGSPLMALVRSRECPSELALIGVIQSRASSTAALAAVDETSYFDLAAFVAFDSERLSEAGLGDWDFGRARSFDSQASDLVRRLFNKDPVSPELKESLRTLRAELEQDGCACDASLRRWSGFLDLVAGEFDATELQRDAVREVIAQTVLDSSLKASGYLYSQWPEARQFLTDYPDLPARFANATEALTAKLESQPNFFVATVEATGQVIATSCREPRDCDELPFRVFAKEELKKLDSYDPGLRDVVLDRLSNELPPGGERRREEQ